MINGSKIKKKSFGLKVAGTLSVVKNSMNPIIMPMIIRKQDSGNTDRIPGTMWKITLTSAEKNIQVANTSGPDVCSKSKWNNSKW